MMIASVDVTPEGESAWVLGKSLVYSYSAKFARMGLTNYKTNIRFEG